MPTWKTASEIEGAYLVSGARLEAYGLRGNLPFRRGEQGELLFDEEAVARLFRARSGSLTVTATAAGQQGFGILGAMRLGEAPSSTVRLSRRELRGRAFQSAREILEQARKAS